MFCRSMSKPSQTASNFSNRTTDPRRPRGRGILHHRVLPEKNAIEITQCIVQRRYENHSHRVLRQKQVSLALLSLYACFRQQMVCRTHRLPFLLIDRKATDNGLQICEVRLSLPEEGEGSKGTVVEELAV